MAVGMRRARRTCVLAVLVSVGAACSEDSSSDPASMSRTDVAARFADAFVSHDFEVMRSLVCPDASDPDEFGGSVFASAEISGDPTTNPSGVAAVVDLEPAPDIFVPYEAQLSDSTETGYIALTLGPDHCVASYTDTRVLN